MTVPSALQTGALGRLVRRGETPCYVYLLDGIRAGIDALRRAIDQRFEISFAIKSNPNRALLAALRPWVDTVDASSSGELDRALAAGYPASLMSFSGPAKRRFELQRAVDIGCGEVVCESPREMDTLDKLAARAGRRMPVLIRICPTRVPAKFGVNMAGRASQFGIDEEDLEAVLAAWRWPALDLVGFHVYSATNALDEDAIAENFHIFADLFVRFSRAARLAPKKLIFGSGFGIPLHDGQRALDIARLGGLLLPVADRLRADPQTAAARLVLEMGRYLVGPHGYFLTSVVNIKETRGKYLVLCDGGFNNHLAACGLLGTVIRRNWMMWNVTPASDAGVRAQQLVGPLCTTIDTLATDVTLPELRVGDVVAVGASGAYGQTASPQHFISHPPAREFLYDAADDSLIDVSELTAKEPATVGAP